jgi:tRNA modification GTPase
MGMKFTKERLDEADIVLFMVDCSRPLTQEDSKIYRLAKERKAILVVNKIDLEPCEPLDEMVRPFTGLARVDISALYNKGIGDLKKTIFKAVTDQSGPADLPTLVPNIRHKMAIERALRGSERAADGLREKRPAELVAIDLKEAMDALGEIIGVTTTEDILDQIFSRFCIGK